MKELSGAELAPMLKSSIQLKSLDGVRVPGLKLSEEDMQWWRDAKLGSDFRYEALQLSSNRVESGTDTEIQVACRVTNISECEGEEVVQLYVRAEASRVKRPRLQLADFKRIALAPGESAEVTFRLQLEGRLTVAGETIPPRDLTWVTRAANGDRGWLAFHDAELGAGISAIELLAAATENAAVEVRLDGPDGPIVGKCEIPAGREQSWRSLTCGLTGASGRRDVYLVLDGPVSLGWFRMMAD